jgi:hypothetical protein
VASDFPGRHGIKNFRVRGFAEPTQMSRDIMSETTRQSVEHFRRMSAKMRKSHKWVPLELFMAADPVSGSEVWRNPNWPNKPVPL